MMNKIVGVPYMCISTEKKDKTTIVSSVGTRDNKVTSHTLYRCDTLFNQNVVCL